jgi:type I restriction enzyme S subunit
MTASLQLGDLADIRVSNVDKRTLPGERVVRLCNYLDVFSNRVLTDDMPFMAASASPHELTKFQLQHGDIAITKDSETPKEIGIPALIDHPGSDLVLGYHLALIRPNLLKTDPYFLLAALQSAQVRQHHRRSATGVTRFGLGVRAIHATPIPALSLDQQQRIGRWYRAACQHIHANAKLLEAMRSQRAWLHQVLTQGAKRFRAYGVPGDGTSPPIGWTERSLGDIAEIRFSNVDKKTRPEELPVRLCNYLDVWRNDYIDDTMPFMQASATASQVAALELVSNDVLITKDSETRDDIAATAVVRSLSRGVVLGYHLALVRPDPAVALGGFVAKQLQAPRFKRHFVRGATGATRYGLALKTIREARVWLPSLSEQREIFATLEKCDFEVLASEQRLKALELQRKRLVEEVCIGGSRTAVPTTLVGWSTE